MSRIIKKDSILKIIYRFFDLIVLTYIVFDFGYSINEIYKMPKLIGLLVITFALLAFNIFKFNYYKTSGRKKVALVNSVIIGFLIFVSTIVALINYSLPIIDILKLVRPILEAGLIFYFIIRLMILVRYIYEVYYNPAIVFVGSFFAIIMIGAFLLLLPNATTNGITFTDALFTSTSAVCVTGLIVVDTATEFTIIGQSIIISLIQIGGLGILTFTSFFAYFFRGSSSFKEGLNVRDFIAQDTLKDVLKTALSVVTFTISVEIIGALFIYSSIIDNVEIKDKVFFSVFHSISAFCNAGFSTLTAGLSEAHLQFNYYMQWVVMLMIIFGGLGYNIIFNFYQYLKINVIEFFDRKKIHKHLSIITLNSKIVLYTTGALLIGGFVFLFLSEMNNTLLVHNTTFGKITTAAFNAVTPRTAGFNTMDFTQFSVPTLLFMIFLMWIGASPASTGGGIKTSTFAVAVLNIWHSLTGRQKMHFAQREIEQSSVNRAFAIISLSLIIIGFAIIVLSILEPTMSFLSLAFEVFSAYSTVGLSLGVTAAFSDAGKIVLIIVMFVGRVGVFSLLSGLLAHREPPAYDFPEDSILIN